MTIQIENERDLHAYYYYVSSIGAIFTSVVVCMTLMHVIRHYIKVFHSKNTNECDIPQAKTSYIMFILMSITTLFICLFYGFFRGNMFISFNKNQFSLWICESTYYSVFLLLIIYSIILYSLFIYRIQIVFTGTMYQYPQILFIILYGLLFIGFSTCAILLFYAYPKNTFAIFQFEDTELLYCGATDETAYYTSNFIATLLYVSLTIIFNIVTLYLFTTKLYALQTELMDQYIREIHPSSIYTDSKPSIITPTPDSNITINKHVISMPATPSVDESDGTKQKTCIINAFETTISDDKISRETTQEISRTISVKMIINSSKKYDSAKRLIALHGLIKKYTILICVICISVIIWLSLTFLLSSWIWI
eukprot:266647_1